MIVLGGPRRGREPHESFWGKQLDEAMATHSAEKNQAGSGDRAPAKGYEKSIELLQACATKYGFLASPTEYHNYHRIWGRDSCIMGLAALLADNSELVDSCRRSLETLASHQGPHGEIPSNVEPTTGRVSYGGTAGRVDSDLWFVICCGAYHRLSGDEEFLESMLEPLEKVRFLLGAWEFNNRGLLFVPPTGDWADEYAHSGYVLYDQLLYLQAQREMCGIHRYLHQSSDHELEEDVSRLKHLIQANFWFGEEEKPPDDVYHEVLYEKGRQAAPHRSGTYWMPFFSPIGYGYRLDVLANALVSLLDVADEPQAEAVDRYLEKEVVDEDVMVLPAFHPVITPQDEDWPHLQMMFTYSFKNEPYEYQNGGLWPMVTGFYAASLARRGKADLAKRYLAGIERANCLPMKDRPWGFPEYLDGQTYAAAGTAQMGWNAATAVIAAQYLEGKNLFES
jgi:glycogen debranching enzyme